MSVRTIQLSAGLALAAAYFAAAQGGTKPSPPPQGAEEQLRARVTEFYQLQQQGKFRASEACVCEDTRDYYYNLGKKSPKNFKVSRIHFNDGSQTAIVQINVTADVAMMGGTFTVDAPVPTQWRQENGTWCFYLTKDQQNNVQTPFGKAPIPQGGAQSEPTPPQAGATRFRPVTVAEVMGGVTSNADTVVFVATKPASAEIVLTNGLPGRVELSVSGITPPGISVNFLANEIAPKETGKVQFVYKPGMNRPLDQYILRLQVEPTRQTIPVTIKFVSPDAAKQKVDLPAASTPKQ